MSKINAKKLSAVLAVLLLAGLVLAGAGAADMQEETSAVDALSADDLNLLLTFYSIDELKLMSSEELSAILEDKKNVATDSTSQEELESSDEEWVTVEGAVGDSESADFTFSSNDNGNTEVVTTYSSSDGLIEIPLEELVNPSENSVLSDVTFSSMNSGNLCVAGNIIIQCDSTPEGIAVAESVTVLKDYRDIVPGLLLIAVPDGMSVSEGITYFGSMPGVEYAEPDYVTKIESYSVKEFDAGDVSTLSSSNAITNDMYIYTKWDLERMGVPEAWNTTTGSSNVVVAILDSGIRYDHEDLNGNMWSDGSGHYGYDYVNNDSNPMDDLGHGTHVAGIIGAVGNNGKGVSGVTQDVSLMAVKVANNLGMISVDWELSGISYAVNNGADILNMSFGGYGTPTASVKSAIDWAGDNGVLVVCSAGNESNDNDTNPAYPASLTSSNIISVAATDYSDTLSSYSNYGKTSVDVGAPGGDSEDGKSAYVNWIHSTYNDSTDSYCYMNGTSMAAPQVTGIAALLLSADSTLSVSELKSAVLSTVTGVSSLKNCTVTGGIVNAAAAMEMVSSSIPVTSVTVSGLSTVAAGSSVQLTAEVLPSNATDKTVTWSSSNTSVATVDSDGKVTGVKVGSVTITATANDESGVNGTHQMTIAGSSEKVTYSASSDNEHAITADGTTASYNNITVTKTGNGSGDNADFYGENAAVFATNGATLTISDADITTSGNYANAVFSYGNGTTVTISDSTITTSKRNSGGIMVTGGGTLNASDLTITTEGGSSAAIRSDRGGGTMIVDGGSYTANGSGSPAIYSTANITVSNATLKSGTAQAVVVEGGNTVTLTDCDVTANNTVQNSDKSDYYQAVMLYQSMSGDAAAGNGSFTMNGGSLKSLHGGMFFVTNATYAINLSDVDLTDADDELLRICAAGWGNSGKNGGNVTFSADNQDLDGTIVVDSISTLDMSLSNGSNFTGAFENAGEVNLDISNDSSWTLTADSSITSLSCDSESIHLNGHTLTVGGTEYTEEETETIPVTMITISGSTKVSAGNTVNLTATVTPANATNKSVTWSSSNTSVATVDSNGKVTGVKAGSVTITATANDGSGVKGTSAVTVTAPTTVIITGDNTCQVGSSVTLKATVSSGSSKANVTWKSSDPDTASVKNGKVTGNKAGTVVITATADGATAEHPMTITPKIKTIEVNPSTVSLEKGATQQLTATVTDTKGNILDPSQYSLTWKSSSTSIATVDANGLVTAGSKTGTATITATCGSVKGTCKVSVVVPVESITISSSKGYTVEAKGTLTLKATVSPSTASNKKVTWSSSNPDVAKVSSSGTVTGVSAGKAIITATAADGFGEEKSVEITVTPKIKSVNITPSSVSLNIGGQHQLTATVTDTDEIIHNTSDYPVTWKSSNTKIATVDENGVVTAGSKTGTATITATCGSVKGTCKVTVKK